MSSWLDGKPLIRDGLMLSFKYNHTTDNSENLTVYTYPKIEYIGNFNPSRFPDGYNVEQINLDDFYPDSKLRIIRYLYPSVDKSQKAQWVEDVTWVKISLNSHKDERTTGSYFSVIYGDPKPFEEVVEYTLKRLNEHE